MSISSLAWNSACSSTDWRVLSLSKIEHCIRHQGNFPERDDLPDDVVQHRLQNLGRLLMLLIGFLSNKQDRESCIVIINVVMLKYYYTIYSTLPCTSPSWWPPRPSCGATVPAGAWLGWTRGDVRLLPQAIVKMSFSNNIGRQGGSKPTRLVLSVLIICTVRVGGYNCSMPPTFRC